jgi:hypothetical protein
MGVISRLVDEWAQRYGVPVPADRWAAVVHVEQWTHIEVGAHLDRLAKIVPAMLTTDKPRWYTGPLVVIDFGQGRIGQIDGRRRANYWRNVEGTYPVLRICVS